MLEWLESRLVPTTTFLQFVQTNPGAENFTYTQNGASAAFSTIPGGDPVLVNFDTSIVQGLSAPQFGHLFLTSTTTSPAAAGPNSSLVEHFPTATNTMQFVLDTPVNGHSNLLTVTYSDVLTGPPNGQAGNLLASTLSVPPDTVTFSSDFVDFTNATERDFSLSFSSIVPGISSGTGGFFVPFVASGTGTFGVTFPGGVIQGQKFQDTNDNGIHDAGEPGLQGWTIDLINPGTGQILQSTVTDSLGDYSFSGLTAGTYRVREVQQPGWMQTTTNPADVTVTVGSDVTGVDFGNFHPAEISGEKFLDASGSGVLTSTDLGLPNWTIQLINPTTGAVLQTTTTDAHGDYSFTGLVPGTYRVREVGQAGYRQTTANPADIELTFAATVTGINFGNALTVPISKMQLISPDFTGLTDGTLATELGFVTGVYQTLLDRPADQAGLVHWVQELQAGISRQQVVTMIWNSSEHFSLEVNQFYSEFLGRSADAAGRAAWVNALMHGLSEADLELAILSSAEFSSLHSTNTAFLTALYADLLGRSPDTAGESAWLTALQNGTSRSAVAAAFLNSVEADSQLIDKDYAFFLHRSPDPLGELIWLARARTSQGFARDLAIGLLSSDEFYSRFRPG
jgi:SdrD B-like domain/Domain of unknown function (DUF4214)